ncbi:MAG: DUF6159 family protein [Salinirussus sp.]
MSLVDRLKTALVLMKDSLLILRHNPGLMLFPVVSGVAGLTFLVIFLGIAVGALGFGVGGGSLPGVGLLILLGILYLVLTFVSVFFTAALVHQTRAVLGGAEPSLRAGIRGAWDVKGPLFAWALISATIGVILNAIQDSNSTIGRILASLFGIAWTLMTFFVVPVIVFEDVSIRGMFERSAGRFKETWGETPLSIAGIGLLSFLLAIPFAVPGYLLITQTGLQLLGFAIIAIGVAIGGVVSHTFKGIVKTALYLYATDGRLPDEFDDVDPSALTRADSQGPTGVTGQRGGGVI